MTRPVQLIGAEGVGRGAHRIASCEQGPLLLRQMQVRSNEGQQSWQGKSAVRCKHVSLYMFCKRLMCQTHNYQAMPPVGRARLVPLHDVFVMHYSTCC